MSDLIEEIKQEIGYVETPGCCAKCKHHSEDDDPVVERMWHSHCNVVADLKKFRVSPAGCCDRFEPAGPTASSEPHESEYYYLVTDEVTHWMPLPAPPSQEQESGQ